MSCPVPDKLSPSDVTILAIVSIIEIFVYFLLVLWMLYMTVVFLFKLSFYKQYHLSLFYLTAWLVVLFRIVYLGMIIPKHKENYDGC